MTEAQFPSGPRDIAQALKSSGNTEPNARAVTLPEAIEAQIKTRREALRLTGEVVRNNDDGSVTVRTERGDIDVRPDNQRTPPERGQRVEVNIPPQRPNSNANDVPVELRHAQAEQSQQRSTSTPVNVEVRPDTAPPAPQQPPTEAQPPKQGLPAEGSTVRLQPATSQTLASLQTPQTAELAASTLPQRIDFQAQIIASEAITQLQETLTNTLQTASPQALENTTPLLNLLTNLQTPQIVNLQNVSAAIPQSIPQGLPQPFADFVTSIVRILPLSTADQLNTQTTTPQTFIQSATLPPSALSVALTETEFSFSPANGQLESPVLNIRPAALDVQITRIELPAVTVGAVAAPIDISTAQIFNPYSPASPDTPAVQILQNQPAPALTGIVTSVTQEQLPIITVVFPQISSEQVFTLQFPSENVTLGSQIQVTPITPPDAALAGVAANAQNVPLTAVLQPATQWPALEEVLQTLARNAPQVTQNILNITPSPANPTQLSPAILFFVAAVRGGDLAQWMGDKAQNILKLQKGGKAMSRIGNESQNMTRIAGETFSNDWKAMNIPMLWQGDLHKVALYYKHDREHSESDDGKIKSTRFVFDLTLENMGQVQLDGLFRPHSEAGTRLDLVVRTEEIFSKATQGEMRRLYALALRDSQVTGELSFQNQPDSWVTIKAQHHEGLSVQS